MLKLLPILLLIVSGIPGLTGLRGWTGTPHAHQRVILAAPAPSVGSCCGNESASSFCPMSGGPCACDVAPMPGPQPRPDLPNPLTERPTLIAVPVAAATIVTVPRSIQTPSRHSPRTFSLLSGRTQREIHALLSTWRT